MLGRKPKKDPTPLAGPDAATSPDPTVVAREEAKAARRAAKAAKAAHKKAPKAPCPACGKLNPVATEMGVRCTLCTTLLPVVHQPGDLWQPPPTAVPPEVPPPSPAAPATTPTADLHHGPPAGDAALHDPRLGEPAPGSDPSGIGDRDIDLPTSTAPPPPPPPPDPDGAFEHFDPGALVIDHFGPPPVDEDT